MRVDDRVSFSIEKQNLYLSPSPPLLSSLPSCPLFQARANTDSWLMNNAYDEFESHAPVHAGNSIRRAILLPDWCYVLDRITSTRPLDRPVKSRSVKRRELDDHEIILFLRFSIRVPAYRINNYLPYTWRVWQQWTASPATSKPCPRLFGKRVHFDTVCDSHPLR